MSSFEYFPTHHIPVNYVYLGSRLPEYALYAFELSAKYSGVSRNLIASNNIKKQLRGYTGTFTPIEDFYDPSNFQLLSKRSFYDSDFRNGFWLKTLERFFVIDQYMNYLNTNEILHIEMDQLVFRIDVLIDKLKNVNYRGIFVPYHTFDHACASIFYCNSRSSLKSFLDFVSLQSVITTDMKLLAAWGNSSGSNMNILPTISTESKKELFRANLAGQFIKPLDIGGLVDAMQIGQWVAGEDPRNIEIKVVPTNHYSEKSAAEIFSYQELKKIRLKIEKDNSLLISTGNNRFVQIYNLHIHSKIHKWLLESPHNIEKLIHYSNLENPSTLPSTRRIQIKYFYLNGLNVVAKHPVEFIKRRLKFRSLLNAIKSVYSSR